MQNHKTFNFQSQHAIGNIGERLFLEYYKQASKTDGRKFDFLIGEKSVELKTDTYPMEKTPNFFFEKYGNIATQALGGPWRAKDDNVDYFVYLFIADKKFFWFEPAPLCAFLDNYIVDLKPKIIDNRKWSTLGYAVPREVCEPFLIEVK